VLLAAIGLSSPQAANGGGPKGQALQTDGGEQTIEPAIGQRGYNARLAAPPALSHGSRCRQLCAHCQNRPTLILIDATAMRIAASRTVPLSSNSRNSGWSFGRHLTRRA
jgi:hypothetical protein